MCIAATAARGQEPLTFRREYVPRLDVESVATGLVPIPRDKFEETIAALKREAAATRPADDRLESAAWIGVYDGERVVGRTRWVPPTVANSDPAAASPAIARLGATNVFLDVEGPATGEFLTEEARTLLGADAEAASVLVGDGGSPELFLGEDGTFGVQFPDATPSRLVWTAGTTAGDDGDRIAEWRLPSASRATMWLVVPIDTEVASDGEWLVHRVDPPLAAEGAAPTARLYRLEGLPSDDRPLRLRFATSTPSATEGSLYRIANRYEYSERGLDVTYEIALDRSRGEVRAIRFRLPVGVSPIELRQGDRRLEFAVEPNSPQADGRGDVVRTAELSQDSAAAPLTLRAIATSGSTESDPLPRLRLEGAAWGGETTVVAATAPMEIQGVFSRECVTLAESNEGASCRFRHRAEDSSVAVRVGRAPGRLEIDSILSLRAGRSSLEATLDSEVTASDGTAFERELRLLRPWSLDRIDVEPPGALLDWSIRSRDERSQAIRLRFREGLAPGSTVRLRCAAHLRIDDASQSWSGQTLRAFEFDADARERRVVALFDEPAVRFRPVRLADWRPIPIDALTPARRAALGESDPSALLADDSTFRGIEFAFETGERRHAVRSITDLRRSGAVVVGSVRIAVEPLAGPLERLRVRFSEPLPPGSRWSSPSPDETWTFEARILSPDEANDGDETWEIAFARPMTRPFEVVASYELPEESSLVAPLASVPSASTQSGRLAIAAGLFEGRELVGEGFERMPAGDDRDASSAGDPALRFRYEPTRRHRAALVDSGETSGTALLAVEPARLETEISSAAAFHVLTYRVASPPSAKPSRLTIPAGLSIDEIRARGGEREVVVGPGPAVNDAIELPAVPGLDAIEMRFHQPLSAFAPRNDLRVALPRIEGLPAGAVVWTVRSRGAASFDMDVAGWASRDAEPADDPSNPRALDSRTVTIAAAPDAELRLTVYRGGETLRTAFLVFFLTAACAWAFVARAPVAAAVSIAVFAVAMAFVPEPLEPLRWGFLYGAAAGFVGAGLFRRVRETIGDENSSNRPALRAAATATFVALALSGAWSAFAQAPPPDATSRTHRVVIPTDDAGQPTGSYYYASREFYDRFLFVQRSLERPREEWRIVGADYEGTMSLGVIDATPRLSELTLHLEIETYAEDVTATIPVNRKYAEFAGMMEGAADGGMEVRWNEAGDALSLTFEQPGRRELRIPFYPAPDATLPPGSRKTTILPLPSARLYVRGDAAALDDLVVTGALGGGPRRVERDVIEYDLGPATDLVFASRNVASEPSQANSVRWRTGLRIVGDPEACRVEAVVVGEAPLGVVVGQALLEVAPGWIVESPATDPTRRVESVEPASPDGSRRYRYLFDEPAAGEIRFAVTLSPEGSSQAGGFLTPRLTFDGAPPESLHAAFAPAKGATCEWSSDAPGEVVSVTGVPSELGFVATDVAPRALPPDGAAIFWIRDGRKTATYALHAEFVLARSEVRARYGLASLEHADRWMTIDLPPEAEVQSVAGVVGERRTALTWRRADHRLFVQASASRDAQNGESGIEIEATTRRSDEAPVRLALPRLVGATVVQGDLRVYREPGLDASIDVGSEWTVDPTFAPGAFVVGKGRGVGAFLSSPASAAGGSDRPAAPTLRFRDVTEPFGAVWTSLVPVDSGFAVRLAVDLDAASGPLDRVAVEAPADLGDPVALSPPGSVTAVAANDAERRYWIFVPDRPLAPGSSVAIQAPLRVASPERLVVAPLRPLNLRATERHVLLPERIGERRAEWSVVRLQATPTSERIAAHADPAMGAVMAFGAMDDRYEARLRRLDASSESGSSPAWIERRVAFDAPGEYRATVAWDFAPRELATMRIAMPPRTTPTSLAIDGVPIAWRAKGNGLATTVLPSALPFRLTLAYRGEFDAPADGATTLALESPSLERPSVETRSARGEGWIVESSTASPWRVDDDAVDAASTLDFVAARLDEFQATFSADALAAEDCTPDEAAAFSARRGSDLDRLRAMVVATKDAAPRRDETLARIDAIAATYGDAAPPSAPGSTGETRKLLAVRAARGEELRAIDIPLTNEPTPTRIPWRRIVETLAVVTICLGAPAFGGRFTRWFEQMPLPVGTLAIILLAALFAPTAWLAPTIMLGFLGLVAFVNRRWLSHLLPGLRGSAPRVR